MKTDRLISIIMILLERKKMTLAELAEICEVSPRTIQRDLDSISQAGVPIVSYPGIGGGVGIMENFKLEKRLFSTGDIASLLMSLENLPASFPADSIRNTLVKVKGIIPEAQRRSIEEKAAQFTVDATPWNSTRDFSPMIATIQSALEEKRLLRFHYRDSSMNKSVRTVEPYRLIFKNLRWYLDGFCLDRQDFRLFKLARISSLMSLDQPFEPRAYFPTKQVEVSFSDGHVPLATLHLKAGALDRVSNFIDIDQLEETAEPGVWIAHIPIPPDESGYKFLLGFGADCQCISPPGLREGFIEYLRQIDQAYR